MKVMKAMKASPIASPRKASSPMKRKASSPMKRKVLDPLTALAAQRKELKMLQDKKKKETLEAEATVPSSLSSEEAAKEQAKMMIMSRLEILKAKKKDIEVAPSSPEAKKLKKEASDASEPGPSVSTVGQAEKGASSNCLGCKDNLSTALVAYQNQGKEMSLQEKMDLYRAGKLGEAAFTSSELTKCKHNFDYARKTSSKLQSAYDKLGGKGGKQDRKAARFMMLAWMKSPEDPDNVVKNIMKLTGKEGNKVEKPWLSMKQLIDEYGEEEAEEMIEDNAVRTRVNPNSKRNRLQYQVQRESEFGEVIKEKNLQKESSCKVESEVAQQLGKAIEGYKVNLDMLVNASLDLGLNLQEAMEDPGFQTLMQEVADQKEVTSKQLALGLNSDGSLASQAVSTVGYTEESLKAKILREAKEEAEVKKKEKEEKRKVNEEKRSQREALLGLDALIACETKVKDLEEEDILKMIKEVTAQGTKFVAESSMMKPKLTKERFSAKFLRDFQVATMALKGAQEVMLNAQGLYQASKCNDKFALKAIATLARCILKIKQLLADSKV